MSRCQKKLGSVFCRADFLQILIFSRWRNTQIFRDVPVTPTPSISPKVLPYKWGAYCRTNGRRTAVQMGGVLRVSLSSKLRSQESAAIQMGGVLPYKLEVYCRTFQTSCRGWGFRNIAQIWQPKTARCRRTQAIATQKLLRDSGE